MTVPFPLDAFDHAQLVVRLKPPRDHSRLISLGITAALHGLILAGAFSAVQVVRQQEPAVLTAQINLQTRELPRVAAPPLRLEQPSVISMVAPDVVIQTQSPVTPPPPVSRPAPQSAAISSPVASEGRDAYLGRLLGQINRHKQYPREARKARIQGTVMLHFMIDAQGKVLSFEIARSSGRPVLDAEALALIQRAQPLPPLPADYPTRTLDAIVPIEFFLNR